MAIETPQQDIADLWSLYHAQKGLVEALQAAIAAINSGGTPDYASISDAGEGGSEGISVATLTDRLDKSIARMTELRRLAIKATPGYGVKRLPNGNLRRHW
jgi:hypothetical protein